MSKYILLSYINRSGSTYLLNLLSKHKGIFTCPEANCLYDLFLKRPLSYSGTSKGFRSKFNYLINNDLQLKVWGLNKIYSKDKIPDGKSNLEMFLNLLDKYKESLFDDSKYIVYKHNNIFKLIQKVPTEFVDSIMFLSLIRDVRSVFVSQKNTISPYFKVPINTNPLLTSYSWNKLINCTLKFSKGRVLFIRYEDILLTQSKTLDDFYKLLSLKRIINQDSTNWLQNRLPIIERTIHQNISKKPTRNNITNWLKKIDIIDLTLIEILSKRYMKRFNYKRRINDTHNIIKIFHKYIKYKIRLILGLDHY